MVGDGSWAALLEKAYDDRSFFLTGIRFEPMVNPLRSDARFVALLGKVGL